MELIFVWYLVTFTVDGQQREFALLSDHKTIAEARESRQGDRVQACFKGLELDVDNPGIDPQDGCKFYLRYVYKEDGRNDTQRMETFSSLADANKRLREVKEFAGFKYPHLYRGYEIPF